MQDVNLFMLLTYFAAAQKCQGVADVTDVHGAVALDRYWRVDVKEDLTSWAGKVEMAAGL